MWTGSTTVSRCDKHTRQTMCELVVCVSASDFIVSRSKDTPSYIINTKTHMFSRLPPFPGGPHTHAHTHTWRAKHLVKTPGDPEEIRQIEDGAAAGGGGGGGGGGDNMKREEDTPVISFAPDGWSRWKSGMDRSKEGRRGGGWDRRRAPWREWEKLLGMNNGWQILRDHVQTLIMDKTQLEGARKRLSGREESTRMMLLFEFGKTFCRLRHQTHNSHNTLSVSHTYTSPTTLDGR